MQYRRNARGALLLLGLVMVFVIVVLFLFSCRIVQLIIDRQRYEQSLQGAALQAAIDLSKIVVNDPYFGFISLSDQLAIGKNLMAKDGEPLPVHSINTIIATTRLDYIVAREVGDAQLEELALQDIQHAREAAMRLDHVLALSLKPKLQDGENVARDMDGNEVHPYVDALKAYEEGIQAFTRSDAEHFELTLGWLRGGGETITQSPLFNRSQTSKNNNQYSTIDTQINGCYRAYIDVPVGDEHFAFASVGPQATQANHSQFVPKPPQANENSPEDDQSFVQGVQFNPEKYNQHLSSIVRAAAEWPSSNLFAWDSNKSPVKESSEACAQPYAVAIQPAPSIFVMAFPDGRPAGINKMADILSNKGLTHATMNIYTPIDGDFPVEPEAHLQPASNDAAQISGSRAFAQAFYDWLRSNYTMPRINAVLDALNQSFDNGNQSGIGSIYVADITAEGNVIVSKLSLNPFADIRINEKQLYAINYTPAQIDGNSWSVVCRDQVHNLGTIAGGKHGGQPMPGDPVNWSELSSYVSDAFATAVVNRKPSGITLAGLQLPGGAIALTGSELLCSDGKDLPRNLRKSTYSGGLGIEIRISSPRAITN